MDKESRQVSRLERVGELTPRQREVLKLLAEGLTMREAGKARHLTARTIAFHKYRIKAEFGLKTGLGLNKVRHS